MEIVHMKLLDIYLLHYRPKYNLFTGILLTLIVKADTNNDAYSYRPIEAVKVSLLTPEHCLLSSESCDVWNNSGISMSSQFDFDIDYIIGQ